MHARVTGAFVFLVLAVAACSLAREARADDVSIFYDSLAPYGTWVTIEPYGSCWVPSDVDVDWRPYTDGYWASTDAGWTWVSDLDWGWACFHYGRWFRSPVWGWCWVPGSVWAPAWVFWRGSDDWIGWCALPPDREFRRGHDFDFDDIDFNDHAWWPGWCFVHKRFFDDWHVFGHLSPLARNVTLIEETKNATKLSERNGRGMNESISVGEIEHATGRSIRSFRLEDLPPSGEHRGRILGGELRMFRPELSHTPPTRTPPTGSPLARPLSQREFMERQEAARHLMEDRLLRDRRELDRLHEREVQRPPEGMELGQIRRRHEDENRAFEEHQRSQMDLFEHRGGSLGQRGDEEQRGSGRGEGRSEGGRGGGGGRR